MISLIARSAGARSLSLPVLLRCRPYIAKANLRVVSLSTRILTPPVCRAFATNLSFKHSALKAMDQHVKRDVVVYTYENARFFRLLTAFGVVQFIFWLNMAGICYSEDDSKGGGGGGGIVGESTRQTSSLLGEDNQWTTMMKGVMEYRHKIGILCLVLANAIILFTWLYPLRSVSKLTLLTGGNSLKITTYSQLGNMKDFTVPLKTTSFMQSRDPASNGSLAMKVKGRRMYFLLDQKNGKFVDPTLFDFVVGLKRKI